MDDNIARQSGYALLIIATLVVALAQFGLIT